MENSTETAAQRVRASFGRQNVMRTIGARLVKVAPGRVEIELPYRDDLTQQHGFLHAGIIATVLDSACGYAALSRMPLEVGVLTVEYKINLMSPAVGERFIARGEVRRSGRTLMVCAGDGLACDGENEKLVATMLATIMVVRGGGIHD